MRGLMIRALVVLLFCSVVRLSAAAPVYVVLWFDTEDYVEASADDAALRIANDLTALGVRATFKVVGEKARVLESRGRKDVIAALARHDIGYHSNWHSVHPTPAEYLSRMGFVEGADEFERREAAGLADVKRVFGKPPSCYGQPGNSWGPQTNAALRRMNVPVYLDEGDQVGLGEQPFWYGGLLYVFHMGKNQFRAQLNVGAEDREAHRRFDEAAARLSAAGGGVISIYYHPTEFVTTEFWDGVNFRHGANPERPEWAKPKLRTRDDSERTYGVLRSFVQHMKQRPDVRFVTARELAGMYDGPAAGPVDRRAAAERLRQGIGFAEVGGQTLSAAELLMAALGMTLRVVDGPTGAGKTTYTKTAIPVAAFGRTRTETVAFVERFGRLPNELFVGPDTLSLVDFAATLAAAGEGDVTVVRGKTAFDGQFSTDGKKSFNWVIHPEGFDGSALLELGRLQGWTLKPARMKK